MRIKNRLALLVFAALIASPAIKAQQTGKLRIMVLTDIEADPDDTQSMVRFLTYANEWDIEGLIATTSIHQKDRVAPESIIKVLDAYRKVQPNLLKHDKSYPSYELLKARVKKGRAVYGMEGVGEGKDSEGSEWIIKALEKNDNRPLWVPVWGGANCLAQALWKIKNTRSPADAGKLYNKLRVYTISDQDDAGPWIRKNFPDIFYICSPGYTYGKATWLGIAIPAPGSDKTVVSSEWLASNIQQWHGPLGAVYPDVAYIMEGDSPSFLFLVPNGLNNPEQPDFGGWGGRYVYHTPQLSTAPDLINRPNWPVTEQETRPLWANTEDSVFIKADNKGYKSIHTSIWRWRTEFQHDFAARMDWTTKSFGEANHPPVPKLAHAGKLRVKSGSTFRLNADGSYDPDGDSMSYLWFQYPEAGSYKGYISFAPYAPNIYNLPVTAPVVEREETIHFILQLTDKGSPALTRYKRVIVTVIP